METILHISENILEEVANFATVCVTNNCDLPEKIKTFVQVIFVVTSVNGQHFLILQLVCIVDHWTTNTALIERNIFVDRNILI